MESLRSTKKHTPKLYFQFWPFQFFILGYGAYFMVKNYDRATVITMMAMTGLGLGIFMVVYIIIICVLYYMFTINMHITYTPTHCCTEKCCHHTLESLSMVCCFSFILFVITAAPTIMLLRLSHSNSGTTSLHHQCYHLHQLSGSFAPISM